MDTKFDWCIRVSRIHFQAIHRDIFENSKRFSYDFVAFLMINIIILYGCCYTVWNYDTQTAFSVGIPLVAVLQVRTHSSVCKLNIYKIISNH